MRERIKRINGLKAKALIHQACVLCAFSLFFLGSAWGAAAPTPAPTPCDPNYFESLKSRAWLEANREITQNQNLIFKPDSVLQYTCFDRFVNELAQEATNMFSQTTRWGGGLSGGNMTSSLQNLVGNALQAYITGNFNHNNNYSLLGGRSTVTYQPKAITPGAYSCDIMQQVWMQAKCMNFNANPNTDGFYTFEEYRDRDDVRQLPWPNNPCGKSTQWDPNIKKATVDTDTLWTEDNLVTYLNMLDPANCTNTSGPNAVYPIETGVVVQRSKTQPTIFNEKVCIPAGCHYEPSGGNGTSNGTCTRP